MRCASAPGQNPPFEAVAAALVQALRLQASATALPQYLRTLAAQARINGLDFERDAATSAA